MKGSYVLIIKVSKPFRARIGALGKLSFKRGYYCYIGSAMGKSVSLEKRIARHLRKRKKLRWHIDYLLAKNEANVTMVLIFKSETRLECELSKKLAQQASESVRGFGSSDCNCESHLHYFASFEKLKRALTTFSDFFDEGYE